MDEVAWTDDLATGENIVDFQHKKLFTYLNILIAATNNKETHATILKNIINALIEYTILHFEDEELVLESIGYPDLVSHQKLHSDCAKQVLNFKQRFEKDEDILTEFILFVKNWLILHIMQEDMKALKFKSQD